MRILPSIVLPLFLAGCAGYGGAGLQAGVSNELEVRRTMGEPALELPNPDGSRQLAYPRGPLGHQTFMVQVGRDGILQAVRPALNEDHFHRIQPGLTRDDVLRLIGPPREVMEFPRLKQVAWDYLYRDAWGYLAIFSVMLDMQGRVVGKTSRRIERNGPFR